MSIGIRNTRSTQSPIFFFIFLIVNLATSTQVVLYPFESSLRAFEDPPAFRSLRVVLLFQVRRNANTRPQSLIEMMAYTGSQSTKQKL